MFYSDIYYGVPKKRELPHVHVLKWLKDRGDCPTPAFIDNLISVKMRGVLSDPLGYVLVEEFMMHSPCGNGILSALA